MRPRTSGRVQRASGPGARHASPAVVIAGGGIAGLTVAYDLKRHGVDCLLVEKEERLGGLIFTTEEDGFLMDAGPDAFLAQKPHGKALCDELGLADELVPTNPDEKKVYVLHGGKLRAMPEGMRLTAPTKLLPLLRSDLFSIAGKLRLMMEPFIPPREAEKAETEESIASFVRRRFGAEALERVGEPLLAGIHCGDPEKLSMTRLFPRLVELEKSHGSVTRGMLHGPPNEGPMFLSLTGGMGRLVSRLREELAADDLRLGCSVSAVSFREEGFEVELTGKEDETETVSCRALLLALPLPAARDLLAGPAPSLSVELGRIRMVSTAVVFLAYSREEVAHPLDGYGFVVPRHEPNRLLAATFVTTKFPGRAPDGFALFRAFLGGTKDPDANRLADSALVELARRELERALGLAGMGEPLLSRVTRWEQRTPQVELGHDAVAAAVARELQTLPGLYVLANGLGGVGIPDSVQNARAAAADVLRYVKSA